MSEHNFIVEEDQAGIRLDIFLTKQLSEGFSRTAVKKMIDGQCATVNDQQVHARHKVNAGDQICIHVDKDFSVAVILKPEKIALDIIYEDTDLIVLNKPVGMLVHPVHGQNSGTLVNALLEHCEKLSTVNDEDRPGIVHRLDRETSGIMVAIKENSVHENLAKQFERHKVKKKYMAVVKGHVELDEGLIDVPIARHDTHFDKKIAIRDHEKGRAAQTAYRVIKRIGRTATIVALFPKTGRTHQLRVHMKYLGHPILGDAKYGNVRNFPRLALHAQSIRFYHLGLSAFFEFSTPLPEEILRAEEILVGHNF